jgi:hypothetical protein
VKKKTDSPYYTYMAPFFETGNDLLIKQAKERYRRMYKALWRKTNRRIIHEVTVSLTKEEYIQLQKEAKRHERGIAPFVKSATMGYINTRYVPLSKEDTTKVLQSLALTQNRIEEIAEERGIGFSPERELKEVLHQLEHQVRVALYSPKTIWQILERVLYDTPELRDELLLYIKNRSP